jgi:hypothetical protein
MTTTEEKTYRCTGYMCQVLTETPKCHKCGQPATELPEYGRCVYCQERHEEGVVECRELGEQTT